MRMKHDLIEPLRVGGSHKRRPTNVTLPPDLVRQARTLEVNVSQACAAGLAAAVAQAEEARWKIEHAEWIAAHRRWVDAHELPLERYRLF